MAFLGREKAGRAAKLAQDEAIFLWACVYKAVSRIPDGVNLGHFLANGSFVFGANSSSSDVEMALVRVFISPNRFLHSPSELPEKKF
jgi:hypothetical protein